MYNPFLNKNAGDISIWNTAESIEKPLNFFFMSCWKFADTIKLNRLP